VEAESRLRKLGREIGAVCLFFGAGFLALCLLTYHPNDPSWSLGSTLQITKVQNRGGVLGSYLSDVLYQGFGLGSFLFVFLLGLLAYWKWFRPETPILGHSKPWLIVRSLGFLLGLTSFSTLLGLWPKEFNLAGPASSGVRAGGALGKVLALLLRETLNGFGAYALTLLLLLVTSMLFFNLSPRELIEELSQAWDRVSDWIGRLWTLHEQRRRRQEDVRVEKEKLFQARSGSEPIISALVKPEKKKAPPKEKPKQEAFDFDSTPGSIKLPAIKLL